MVDHLANAADADLGLTGWLGFQLYGVALHRGLAERGFTDLREADWTLVRFLAHRGGATVTEIARLFEVTKQAASQQVATFVERGYGERCASEDDARTRVVRLTDRGRAAHRAAVAIADEVEAELRATAGDAAVDGWRAVNRALVERHLGDASTMVQVAAEMGRPVP